MQISRKKLARIFSRSGMLYLEVKKKLTNFLTRLETLALQIESTGSGKALEEKIVKIETNIREKDLITPFTTLKIQNAPWQDIKKTLTALWNSSNPPSSANALSASTNRPKKHKPNDDCKFCGGKIDHRPGRCPKFPRGRSNFYKGHKKYGGGANDNKNIPATTQTKAQI